MERQIGDTTPIIVNHINDNYRVRSQLWLPTRSIACQLDNPQMLMLENQKTASNFFVSALYYFRLWHAQTSIPWKLLPLFSWYGVGIREESKNYKYNREV